MKLLKVHTTNRGVTYRIEIHAYNLVKYACFAGLRNRLRTYMGYSENLGTTLITKNDFT